MSSYYLYYPFASYWPSYFYSSYYGYYSNFFLSYGWGCYSCFYTPYYTPLMELYSPFEFAVDAIGYQQVPEAQLEAVADKVEQAVD